MGYVASKKYDGVQLYHKSNKDISYYIRYRDEYDKLVRIKIGDKSKGITEPFCSQKRSEIINSIRLGTEAPIKHKKRNGILFETVAKKYFEDLELHSAVNTIKDFTSKYNNHLSEYIGNLTLDRITIEHLEKLQKDRIKILSEKTVNQLIELVGTIFNYAIKKDLSKVPNPTIKIKKFKIDNVRERFLAEDEITILFNELRENNLLVLFLKFALTTGGRLETLLHIQKKDIDLMSKTLTLHDLKNKDTYKGFLTDDIIKLIKPNFKQLKANDYLISLDGTKTTSRQIQSRLKPKLDKLFNEELEKSDRKNRVVIHTLRHTFASHLAIKGTPIFTIQNLMNHKDIKQTMRYAKLAPDSGRNFVNELYR